MIAEGYSDKQGKMPIEKYVDESGVTKFSKYHRMCKGVAIDVYDVLVAWEVTNPATQHAIKKLLQPGKRGHKTTIQDLTEAGKSIDRAIEIETGHGQQTA